MHDSQTTQSPTSLTSCLEAAANGASGAAPLFFVSLLRSEVFVALLSGDSTVMPQIGTNSLEVKRIIRAESEGHETVPFFSEEIFVNAWGGEHISIEKIAFKDLLTLVPENSVWMHLNPGQEWGKDFTPWEVSLLRRGEDAVPELVSELEGGDEIEIEVDTRPDYFEGLKRQMRPVLEAYEDIDEALLVAQLQLREHSMGVGPGGEAEPAGDVQELRDIASPILGLKMSSAISEERKRLLEDEFRDMATDHMHSECNFSLVVDLADNESASWGLFRDAVPFYSRWRSLDETKPEPESD